MLGRSISLSGEPYTVIGIVGAVVRHQRVRRRTPTSGSRSSSIPNTSDQGHYFQVAGKLKAGVSIDAGHRPPEGRGR